MGSSNEKVVAWTKQEGRDGDSHSRWHCRIGQESEFNEYQPERADRADSTGSIIYRYGNTNTGGVISQLIGEYREQLALKQQEIEQIQTKLEELEELQTNLGNLSQNNPD